MSKCIKTMKETQQQKTKYEIKHNKMQANTIPATTNIKKKKEHTQHKKHNNNKTNGNNHTHHRT